MSDILKRSHAVAVFLTCCVIVCWFGILFYKYQHFGYYDWDLAYFAQAMSNLTHGSLYVSIFDANFFANHSNLISILLIPIYKLIAHPFLLVLLKLLSYAMAGYLIYVLFNESLGGGIAICLMLLYFIYPPNVFGLLYEFDFESIAPGLLVLLCYLYKKDNWLWFMFTAILIILIKENLPLIILAFGIWGLINKKNKIAWGVAPILLGAGSFMVLTSVVIPLFGSHPIGHHPYVGHYAKLGNSLPEILINLIIHPSIIAAKLFSPHSMSWFFELLAPLLFIPLADPVSLFLVFPIVLQHLLSTAHQEQTIYYAYGLTLAPFLFVAIGNVLISLKISWRSKALIILIAVLILSTGASFWNHWPQMKGRYMVYNDHLTQVSNQMIEVIPPQAPVIATLSFLAKLSQRPAVYGFHKVYDAWQQRKEARFKCPDNVRYALINSHDPWLMNALRDDPQARGRIQSFIKDGGWRVIRNDAGIVLYER